MLIFGGLVAQVLVPRLTGIPTEKTTFCIRKGYKYPYVENPYNSYATMTNTSR
jgi:hypothetical protein